MIIIFGKVYIYLKWQLQVGRTAKAIIRLCLQLQVFWVVVFLAEPGFAPIYERQQES